MNSDKSYSFWGSFSPLGGLSGAALMIIASARLSWAIVIAGSLFWVYALTTITFAFMSSAIKSKYFPAFGKAHVFTCIASFYGSVYILLFWLACPFAAFEVFLPLLLVPLYCAASLDNEGSGIFERIVSAKDNVQIEIIDHVSNAVSQAAVLAVIIIVFSIIREPLAYCSLSIPGTYNGMITIMFFRSGSFFPIGAFATSAGALLLLGYFICLYQYSRNAISGRN